MSQIIAIDLGTYSIKVASLDLSKAKSGFSYQDRIIPQVYGSEEFSFKEALADLIDEGLNINETVIITFPDTSVSTHSISLPFTDNRKIEQILPMQLDEKVPFDLSEYFVTYQVLSKNEHGSEVVAATTKDQKLQDFFTELEELEVNPKFVTPHVMAFNALAKEDFHVEDEHFAILDIGHSSSSLTIFDKGNPTFYRSFQAGGHYINLELMESLDLKYFDCDNIKIRQSTLYLDEVPVNIPPERRSLADSALKEYEKIAHEVFLSFGTYFKQTENIPTRLFLTGGGSQIVNCKEFFKDRLEIETEDFYFSESAINVNGNQNHPDQSNMKSHALAISGIAPRKNRLFNYRKGKYSFTGHWDFLLERKASLITFFSMLLVCMIGFLSTSYYVIGEKDDQLKKKVRVFSKKMFGKSKSMKWIERELKNYESPTNSVIPQITALDIFAEITKIIPQDVEVNLSTIEITLQNIFIKGEIDTFENVDVLYEALKKYNCLKNIQRTNMTTDKNTRKVIFNFDGKISC